MNIFDEIIECICNSFKIDISEMQIQQVVNVMLIRINGLDDNSIASYIHEKFPSIKITTNVANNKGYKRFSNEWIKFEK